MQHLIILCSFIMLPFCGYGQYLLAASTAWDDSFTEWDVFMEVDSLVIEGELETTFRLGGSLEDWNYRIGDEAGSIKQKFSRDTDWELISDEETVSIHQVWPSDKSEWKISNGSKSIVLKTKWSNSADEWIVSTSDVGDFIIYSEYTGDPRDWLIEDYMTDDVSFSMRMAATFIAIYTSMPKE